MKLTYLHNRQNVFIQTIMCKSCVKYTVHDFIAKWYAKW